MNKFILLFSIISSILYSQNIVGDNAKNHLSRVIQGEYTKRGPSNFAGRVRDLAYDISDTTGNTIFAAFASGGLYKTINGGDSWTRVSPLNQPGNITTITQDPTNTNVWYYGTGEITGNTTSLDGALYIGSGIWRSENNGTSWEKITASNNPNLFDTPFDYINALDVNPINGTLLAAISGAIVSYTPSSQAWNTELGSSSLISQQFTDVIFANDGKAYASFGGNASSELKGIWELKNGIWSRIINVINNIDNINNGLLLRNDFEGRIKLALAPSNNSILYALYRTQFTEGSILPDIAPDVSSILFKYNLVNNIGSSLDIEFEGNSASLGFLNAYFNTDRANYMGVTVHPTNPNYVILNSRNLYRATNTSTQETFRNTYKRIGGTESINSLNPYQNGGDPHSPFISVGVFNPFSGGNDFLTGANGGVHRSSNITTSSVTWNSLNNGFQTVNFNHVSSDSSTDNIIYGASAQNGAFVTTQGNQMSNFGSDFIFRIYKSREPASSECLFYSLLNGFLIKSCSGTETTITPDNIQGSDVPFGLFGSYMDPDDNSVLFYAGNQSINRTNSSNTVTSTNGWMTLGSLPQNRRSITFASTRGEYNEETSYLLLGSQTGAVFKLNNYKNVSNLNGITTVTPNNTNIGNSSFATSIGIHPTNRNIAMVTYPRHGDPNIWLSSNMNSETPTWTQIDNNLSSFSIRSSAIVENQNGETFYLVGTDRGLYARRDSESDWVLQSPDLIGVSVVSSLSFKPSSRVLTIGTLGNGAFQLNVDTLLSTSDVINNNNHVTIWPNPAKDILNVSFKNLDSNHVNYKVYNSNGQLMMSNNFEGKNKITVSGFNAGIYYIVFHNKSFKETHKFIKK